VAPLLFTGRQLPLILPAQKVAALAGAVAALPGIPHI